MKRTIGRFFAVVAAVMFLSITVMELNAHAKAGGSRSMGSRGSRSYSKPAAPGTQPAQQRQQAAPAPGQMPQQPASGGFLRSMAGGIMGGMLGSMLFSSFAGAGGHGAGSGGGIGLFGIVLLAGLGYLIYRFIKKKREESQLAPAFQMGSAGTATPVESYQPAELAHHQTDADTGISHIRQMDQSFSETAFHDTVMDYFFKIQAGWMNRDLSKITGLLTDEMRLILQKDIDQLVRDKQINRLENIAVRKVEIAEAWQEAGQDYLSALVHANLLDYTTDESTGAVVSGSSSDPIKFEEFWTFTRPVGNNPWKLSAIHQP
jgi:predicted lipid-binding transport protein (Tim44 family)